MQTGLRPVPALAEARSRIRQGTIAPQRLTIPEVLEGEILSSRPIRATARGPAGPVPRQMFASLSAPRGTISPSLAGVAYRANAALPERRSLLDISA
ncbi:MAG: hypothetical protein ACI9W2_005214 [Gammaproteobacteria bacterium]|jgi:hypothetical protein